MNKLLSLANSRYGKGKHYSGYYAEKKKWKALVSDYLQAHQVPRFEGKVWIAAEFHVPTRANDPDNVRSTLKFILDGFTPPKKDEGDRYWIIRSDNLTIVQSPYFDQIKINKESKVVITISDQPLYQITALFDEKDILSFG
jgi:hypothetical protein